MSAFFYKVFRGWSIKRMKREIQEFIDKLKVLDSDDIGMVVAYASHYKNQLEQDGHEVTDPIVYYTINPDFNIELGSYIEELQKTGKLQDAAALMVWAHTMRAGSCLELRGLGRQMWKELERGFPYVEKKVSLNWFQ